MQYDFNQIEKKWQEYWATHKVFKAIDGSLKPKFYSLDMFPYPSGAGLHVGHPLGYIASDIYSRYKRLMGYNVLHPMGYDSFGLPTEQYAIQTGIHPNDATLTNVARYRKQLDQLGFSFDWDREVKTSDPDYYRWTQWIFKQLFDAWYNIATNKAEPIATLIQKFEASGNQEVDAATAFDDRFTAEEWKQKTEAEQHQILLDYRLTYLSEAMVNWCPELGTVLANDEVKNGVSERGGYPVVQKKMKQWSMRITAYAERLLQDLEKVDWSDSVKDIQRNWIGKSKGASVQFSVSDSDFTITTFTTRPDTIFGVSFMVLAPEHELVEQITTEECSDEVLAYQNAAALKSERDRMSDVKTISGVFTGAYAVHPFSGEQIPIWIGDYVLASYGTGAVMAVPAGDQRDWDFAHHFGIEIKNIFKDKDISEQAYAEKDAVFFNSDFLDGLSFKEATKRVIDALEEKGIGSGKVQYRLRDAVFSRQRFWGEPIPIFYKDGVPYVVEDEHLPLELPVVDKYLPTQTGEPPLARAAEWETREGYALDTNIMPGWAGSSWYFLRYMDPNNASEFVAKEKVNYWQNVDLYIGGAEHATGHLLYARFWTKFLYDLGYIPFDEPFKKMINQGMIQGNSALVYRDKSSGDFISKNLVKDKEVAVIHVDINLLEGDVLDVEGFKAWRNEFKEAKFVLEDGQYVCGREIDKMSKSKYNVQTPDDLVVKYGADTLRCYEMFLGPLEQHKPWDTQGITGVHNFLKKFWKLFHGGNNGAFLLDDGEPSDEALTSLHKTIKKVKEDIERYSFNTPVSAFMICVNELTAQKCNNRTILQDLCILISSYAPHITEELWHKLGNEESITYAVFPKHDEKYLTKNSHKYPVSFNGKMRFTLELPVHMTKEAIEHKVLSDDQAKKWLDGKSPKKVIVVPQKIVNIVI